MDVDEHGGGCCGVHHVFNFDHATVDDFQRALREVCPNSNPNRLAEVVLSERQVVDRQGDDRITRSVRDAGGWPAVLQEAGFRLVSRWRNSNSGHNCYLFVMVPTNLSLRPGDLPFAWTHERNVPLVTNGEPTAVAPVAPPPVARRVVSQRFHNVYRTSGRSESSWPTRAAAAALTAGRIANVVRIDRCDVYNDGQVVWTEGV